MNTMISEPIEWRLVAVVNKRVEPGTAMNALLHMGAGLVNLLGNAEREALQFLDFSDADGVVYSSISARSFIVLKGGDAEIAQVREKALAAGLPTVSFLESMTGGSYVEQLESTQSTTSPNVIHYGVAMLGPRSVTTPLTRKLSLWK